jgi:hypothetical protein
MPEAPIPEYNTGVILFRSSEEVKTFMKTWQENYMNINEEQSKRQPEGSPIADQPSFRYSVFQHSKNDNEFSFLTLPPEYNVLTNSPGFLRGTAKILHGKHEDTTLAAIAETLNHHTETPGWDKRVYYPAPWPWNGVRVKADCINSTKLRSKLLYKIQKYGLRRTIIRLSNRILK